MLNFEDGYSLQKLSQLHFRSSFEKFLAVKTHFFSPRVPPSIPDHKYVQAVN